MGKPSKGMAGFVVTICIVAITAFAGMAHAGYGGCGGEFDGKHQRDGFRKIAKKLGLTDAQKTQAKALFAGNKDVVKPLFTSLRAERKNLQSLLHADTVDEAAIRAETAKIAGIQADLNVHRAKAEAEFRAILTPSQVATLKSLYQKRQNKEDITTAPSE